MHNANNPNIWNPQVSPYIWPTASLSKRIKPSRRTWSGVTSVPGMNWCPRRRRLADAGLTSRRPSLPLGTAPPWTTSSFLTNKNLKSGSLSAGRDLNTFANTSNARSWSPQSLMRNSWSWKPARCQLSGASEDCREAISLFAKYSNAIRAEQRLKMCGRQLCDHDNLGQGSPAESQPVTAYYPRSGYLWHRGPQLWGILPFFVVQKNPHFEAA